MLFECGPFPSYIHLASTRCHSHDKFPSPSPFLLLFHFSVLQRAKTEEQKMVEAWEPTSRVEPWQYAVGILSVYLNIINRPYQKYVVNLNHGWYYSDGVNSHQGLEDALGSSTHHFLAWCTSDRPEESHRLWVQACIYHNPLETGLHRHGPAYQPCTLTLQVNS